MMKVLIFGFLASIAAVRIQDDERELGGAPNCGILHLQVKVQYKK